MHARYFQQLRELNFSNWWDNFYPSKETQQGQERGGSLQDAHLTRALLQLEAMIAKVTVLPPIGNQWGTPSGSWLYMVAPVEDDMNNKELRGVFKEARFCLRFSRSTGLLHLHSYAGSKGEILIGLHELLKEMLSSCRKKKKWGSEQ